MHIRGRLLAIVIAGLAAMPAPRLFAHGNEYLFARLAIAADGQVVLELTADIANPLFTSEMHARTVLAEALRLRSGEGFRRLDELGPLHFEHRSQYSADSPIPASNDAAPHQLLTAVWRATMPGQSLVFATPERTPHDVVLWQVPPAGQTAEWRLLICGEQCSAIEVPTGAAEPSARAYWLGGAMMAIVLSLGGWLAVRATRTRPTANPIG